MGEATIKLVRRKPRIAVVLAVVSALALAALLLSSSAGRATSDDSPYTLPSVVDTNPAADVVETTIVSSEAAVDIGNGVTANVQAYNGAIPGPTFHLKVGDTVIVHYRNELSHPSAIHWHGIELSNAMDGTPFTQNQVPTGGEFLYKFEVTRPGIFWYHPHHHSSTNQVYKGLYGMMLVEDPNDPDLVTDGTLPPASQTVPLVLSDLTVCKAQGSNDGQTYPTGVTVPWSGPGGQLTTVQPSPWPVTLCEAPTAIDEDGNPGPSFNEGDVPSTQNLGAARTNEGQTVLTNGMNVGGRAGSPAAPGALDPGARTLDVQAGQGLRLPIVNAATTRYMRLLMTTSAGVPVPLVRVGGEAGLLDDAVVEGGMPGGFDTLYAPGEILLPPGTRADVVAAIPPAAAGVLTLWTQDYQRVGLGTKFSFIPTVPVMHLNVTGPAPSTYTIAPGTPLRSATGDPVPTLGAPTDTLLDPGTFAPTKLGMPLQDIVLGQVGALLGVNGFFGTHDAPGDYTGLPHLGSSRYAVVGDLLELTVTNSTDAHHPFHLHGFSIQPVSLTRPAFPTYTWPYSEFRDNVDIPARYTLTYRIRLDERELADGTTSGGAAGRWVFHCHIFFHATLGMLGELVVVPSSNGNERPNVNTNGTRVFVDEGANATMTGTWQDPDGDPVTLAASLGTVTDTGSGTWSWSRTATAADAAEDFVYITATDSGGRRNQTVFAYDVTAAPPPPPPPAGPPPPPPPLTPALTLAPATATNPVGASHTVTATLAGVTPPSGRTIAFTVTGAHSESGSATTSAAGSAPFSYTGTAVGDDTITACFDANSDGDCGDAGDPKAIATKTWTFAVSGLDHFKCYTVTPTSTRSRAVTLTDQFGRRSALTGDRRTLCNPASKDGGKILNPTAHLTCYATRDATKTFSARAVRVTNQFGTGTLRVLRPMSLCLPALKRKGTTAPAGKPPATKLDHFRCYEVTAKAVSRTVRLRDQFTSKTNRVVRVVALCNPVAKVKGNSNAKVRRPNAHLVCYAIRDSSARRRVTIRNQFETKRLQTHSASMLCLPSLKKDL